MEEKRSAFALGVSANDLSSRVVDESVTGGLRADLGSSEVVSLSWSVR